VSWRIGGESSLKVYGGEILLLWECKAYRGKLSKGKDRIEWDDGDVWMRKNAPVNCDGGDAKSGVSADKPTRPMASEEDYERDPRILAALARLDKVETEYGDSGERARGT
jgi:hypothetical protein